MRALRTIQKQQRILSWGERSIGMPSISWSCPIYRNMATRASCGEHALVTLLAAILDVQKQPCSP